MSAEYVPAISNDTFSFAKSLRNSGHPDMAYKLMADYANPKNVLDFNTLSDSQIRKAVEVSHFILDTELALASPQESPDFDLHLENVYHGITEGYNHPQVQEVAKQNPDIELSIDRDRINFLSVYGSITANPLAYHLAIKKTDEVITRLEDKPEIQATLAFEKTRLQYANDLASYYDLKKAYDHAKKETIKAKDWQNLLDVSVSFLTDTVVAKHHPINLIKASGDMLGALLSKPTPSEYLSIEKLKRPLKLEKRYWHGSIFDESLSLTPEQLHLVYEAPKAEPEKPKPEKYTPKEFSADLDGTKVTVGKPNPNTITISTSSKGENFKSQSETVIYQAGF